MPHSSSFTALYDANVLYPAPLRDLLMWLALTGLFRAKWTETILEEYARNLVIKRPDISRDKIDNIKHLMNKHVCDALIEGYQNLIPAIEGLPDPDDRHVLAAAIVGRADIIVTYNLRDFPETVLGQYNIEAQHPDEFVRHLIDLNESLVCSAAKKQRATLNNPPKSVEEFLDGLAKQQLPLTVAALRELGEFL
ncbi:MAG: PIN domain-containing protein [Chloroflexi bacterium AL-W]|nr:PIN domain-containing protein [Chloroflexi bacterium AL-N1]NOK65481.1 PIN domain-containing protein [Chloroflexi bacterium AL-N10]NOK72253.1 PIN domain-containing protein [Chloroflexi bacterium AL-N5]NOK79661.1 PIN domain-containing protein [Chloroflexi bacterium AL-W]NOK87576.1 PIN domain-containing protein [Chloroflexi bacterium AL-N15]